MKKILLSVVALALTLGFAGAVLAGARYDQMLVAVEIEDTRIKREAEARLIERARREGSRSYFATASKVLTPLLSQDEMLRQAQRFDAIVYVTLESTGRESGGVVCSRTKYNVYCNDTEGNPGVAYKIQVFDVAGGAVVWTASGAEHGEEFGGAEFEDAVEDAVEEAAEQLVDSGLIM